MEKTVQYQETKTPVSADAKAVLEQLLGMIKDNPELAKEAAKALRPQTAAQLARQEALKAIESFRSIPITEVMDNGYETYGDLIEDFQTLERELKSHGKGGGTKVRKAKKKWCFVNGDPFSFEISLSTLEGDDAKLSVHPDVEWIETFLDYGYTQGQVAHVRKARPYRKDRGFLTQEVLDELNNRATKALA